MLLPRHRRCRQWIWRSTRSRARKKPDRAPTRAIRIEHAALNTDKALKRTKDLGVIVSTQPQVIRLMGDALREQLGEDRANV